MLVRETLASYNVDNLAVIDVVGYFYAEDPDNFEFYDLYDDNGICINEGDPFFDKPTFNDIVDYYHNCNK